MIAWHRERPGSAAWLDLGEEATRASGWSWLSECPAVDLSDERQRLALLEACEGRVGPSDEGPRLFLVAGAHERFPAVRTWNNLGGFVATDELVPALWHPTAPSILRELCRQAWRDPYLHIVYGRDSVGPFWTVQAHRADTRPGWRDAFRRMSDPRPRHEAVAWVRCLLEAPPPTRSRPSRRD